MCLTTSFYDKPIVTQEWERMKEEVVEREREREIERERGDY